MLNEFIKEITQLQSDFEKVKKLNSFFEHQMYMLALAKAWNLPIDGNTLHKESFTRDIEFFIENFMSFYIEDVHYYYLKSEIRVFYVNDKVIQVKSYEDFKRYKQEFSSLQHETSKT